MGKQRLWLLVAVSLASRAVQAQSTPEQLQPAKEAVRQETVAVPKARQIDDYLLEYAENAKVNCFFDVTNVEDVRVEPFPAKAREMFTQASGKIDPRALKPTLLNILVDFSQRHKLSLWQQQPRTFLLWPEKDWGDAVVARAQRLKASGALAIPEQLTNTQQQMAFEEKLVADLTSWLKETRRWDGKVLKKPIDIAWHELPNDLSARLDTRTKLYLISPLQQRSHVLEDSFWKVAHVRIVRQGFSSGSYRTTHKMEVVTDYHSSSFNAR